MRLSPATTTSRYVAGIYRRSPPMYRISKVPLAWFTLPAPRNSSALNTACVTRWKMAGANAPIPSAAIM